MSSVNELSAETPSEGAAFRAYLPRLEKISLVALLLSTLAGVGLWLDGTAGFRGLVSQLENPWVVYGMVVMVFIGFRDRRLPSYYSIVDKVSLCVLVNCMFVGCFVYISNFPTYDKALAGATLIAVGSLSVFLACRVDLASVKSS